jgi:hypothetical protein
VTEILNAIEQHPWAFAGLVFAIWFVTPSFSFRWKGDDK